jgi:hypothetical protein
MKYQNIVFFNHWHYGDLFSTRGLVTDIKNQYPGLNYYYVHGKNAAATDDLAPTENSDMLGKLPQHVRIIDSGVTLYINTWVGAYQGLWHNVHPSYISHCKIYEFLYKELMALGINLQLNPDVWSYVPDIDYDIIDKSVTNDFVKNAQGKILLFCNGAVQSTQSSMGNMAQTMIWLSKIYDEDTFVATEKFATTQPNIWFTDDIYDKKCDIIDISYLSRSSHLIVGKNSGPFTYASTRYNLQDASKMFWCFSHKPEDVLPYGLDIRCDFRFSTVVEDWQATAQLSKAIRLIHEYDLTSGWNTEEYTDE